MDLMGYAKRAVRGVAKIRSEAAALARLKREHGTKTALLHRAKVLLSLEQLTNGAFETHGVRVADLESRQSASEAEKAKRASEDAQRDQLLSRLALSSAKLTRELDAIAELRSDVEDAKRVSAWEAYLAGVSFSSPIKVSVVIATYNRASVLPAALASVLEQSYTNFEIVIADDGSSDETPSYLATLRDPRIRVLTLSHVGVSAARNAALAAATGDVIAYLDDDNVMHRHWLKAVAWSFHQAPSATVLYGARVTETTLASEDKVLLVWNRFDRDALLQNNFIDMGSIAHRAGLPEAIFDEQLDACVDWDLMLRLSRTETPLRVPHVSHFYKIDQPKRIGSRDNPSRVADRVRRKHSPPLRVLFYEAMYPLRTETYMTDEHDALTARGFAVAVARHYPSAGPISVDIPVYDDLDTAVAEFKPDVLLMHWATHAVQENATLARLGIPYAVRVHSYDAHLTLIDQLRSDPLCFGIWAFPQFARKWPGTMTLPAIFPHTDKFAPVEGTKRSGLAIVAASLPKRNWPMVHDVLERLPGIEKRVVLGITNEYEHFPFEVIKESASRGHGAIVQVNMDRNDIAGLLQRTSVMLYTLNAANEPVFGMPQCVLEAMLCGSSIILPNWPAAHELAGPSARYYDTPDDIVRHVRECEAGGPAVDAERKANRAWMMALIGSPEHADKFAHELNERALAWRRKHKLAPRGVLSSVALQD